MIVGNKINFRVHLCI